MSRYFKAVEKTNLIVLDHIHQKMMQKKGLRRLFHPYDKRSLIKRLLGFCDCPYHKRHWFVYPKTIRQHSSYQDEQCNWITCCEGFYNDEIAPYWEEMWSDYYSDRL